MNVRVRQCPGYRSPARCCHDQDAVQAHRALDRGMGSRLDRYVPGLRLGPGQGRCRGSVWCNLRRKRLNALRLRRRVVSRRRTLAIGQVVPWDCSAQDFRRRGIGVAETTAQLPDDHQRRRDTLADRLFVRLIVRGSGVTVITTGDQFAARVGVSGRAGRGCSPGIGARIAPTSATLWPSGSQRRCRRCAVRLTTCASDATVPRRRTSRAHSSRL